MFTLIILILILICLILILFIYNDYLSFYNTDLKLSNNKKIIYDNKKTCILISGQVRQNYYESLLSQKLNLIDPLNADVFCVFEDDIEIEDKNKIIKLLKPKYILWLNKHVNLNKSYSPNIIYMFEKIYLCNNLKKNYEKENNFIYDFAIRIRPDLHIKSKIPSNIVNKTENNTLYSPCLFKLDYFTNTINFGITDQIWVSNSTIMNIVSDIFLDLIKKKEKFKNLCQVPEIILKKYILKNNIKIKFFYDFYFILDNLNNNNISVLSSLYYIYKKPYNMCKCIKN